LPKPRERHIGTQKYRKKKKRKHRRIKANSGKNKGEGEWGTIKPRFYLGKRSWTSEKNRKKEGWKRTADGELGSTCF